MAHPTINAAQSDLADLDGSFASRGRGVDIVLRGREYLHVVTHDAERFAQTESILRHGQEQDESDGTVGVSDGAYLRAHREGLYDPLLLVKLHWKDVRSSVSP